MSDELTPTEGARFLFERASEDEQGARYRIAIYAPGAMFSGTATLGYDGSVAVELEAPAELASVAEMFAKLTARSANWRRPRRSRSPTRSSASARSPETMSCRSA